MARILCVDDEPNVANLKCAILEGAGHTATPATSAREAISLMESQDFDAIVTDWRLGSCNAHVIVKTAKMRASTPVVVVSGYVGEAYQAPKPLADLYLEKPANPEELVTILNELLKASDHHSRS
jgi:CheY-like chemotaxis protein